ncbi:hypothetical protein NDN08_005313 [Rhodosorus marinus]|uniref:Uncharacterized protein n=1 Tax=Rhodosorus marinus TaxID=101924 RepID=A0AAV8V3M9_9RHOD|nr:hypothetical protein NDN08_005313 [Rhodosorus marinus]
MAREERERGGLPRGLRMPEPFSGREGNRSAFGLWKFQMLAYLNFHGYTGGPALDLAMGKAQLDPRRSWLSLLDRNDSRKGESADAVWTKLYHRRLRPAESMSDLIHYFEDEFAEITEITREEPREAEKMREHSKGAGELFEGDGARQQGQRQTPEDEGLDGTGWGEADLLEMREGGTLQEGMPPGKAAIFSSDFDVEISPLGTDVVGAAAVAQDAPLDRVKLLDFFVDVEVSLLVIDAVGAAAVEQTLLSTG